MKEQPAVLGLIMVIAGLLVFIFYALHEASVFRDKLMTQVFANAQTSTENAKNIHEILAQRAVSCPPDNPNYRIQSDEIKPAELPK